MHAIEPAPPDPGCEAFLDALLEATRDAVFLVGPVGRIVDANPAAQALTGCRRAELIGVSPDGAIHPDGRGHPTSHGDDCPLRNLGAQLAGVDQELTVVRGTGDPVAMTLRIDRVPRDGGAGGFLLMLCEAAVADTAELHAERDRLAELEKVKSHFLNLAAHELRGPLALARGYVSMLAEGTFGPPTAVDFRTAEPILTGKLTEMSSLVDEMLAIAEMEEGHLQLEAVPFDLRQVVHDALRMMAPLAQHHHLLVVWTDTDMPVVGDRTRLVTILTNLIDNACKYSQRGTAVEVTCRQNGPWLGIDVRDRGLGIAEQDWGTIFQRFGRVVTPTNSHIPGSGLGLYLCRELASMHGGSLTFTSAPGVGSTFTLQLPRSARGGAEPDAPRQPGAPPVSGSREGMKASGAT